MQEPRYLGSCNAHERLRRPPTVLAARATTCFIHTSRPSCHGQDRPRISVTRPHSHSCGPICDFCHTTWSAFGCQISTGEHFNQSWVKSRILILLPPARQSPELVQLTAHLATSCAHDQSIDTARLIALSKREPDMLVRLGQQCICST